MAAYRLTAKSTLIWTLAGAFAVAGFPFAPPAAGAAFFAADDAARSDAYREGQRALADEKWHEALKIFRSIADDKKADADAALYWTAWTEWKLGRKGAALGTLRSLRDGYPKSAWLDDARVLELEIDGRDRIEPREPKPPKEPREPKDPKDPKEGRDPRRSVEIDEDEEIKLYALDGLMQVEPEKAVPILEKFLAGNHSLRLKERALFVLAQSDAPRARQILIDLVRRGTPPELRLKAVEQLGVAGGREDIAALATIWKESTPEVKRKVLEAWMVAGVGEPVFDVAKSEADPGLRRKAIEMLGVMGATRELGELYATERDPDVRAKLLEAYGVAGDEQALLRAAKTETDPRLRRKAIESIGVFGGRDAARILVSLYESETEYDIKAKIVESLMVAGDAKPLVELFKKEKDRALKRKILQQIAVMGDEETAELFADLLEEKP
jgi:HEAT repeat protein